MKKIHNKNTKKPVKMWLKNIDQEALVQAENLANLPFTFKHVALMPDAHFGYGMPIGGVLATKGVVIPNAVGVDIGCGMCALPTTIEDLNTPELKKIMSGIRKRVPLGHSHHKKAQDEAFMPFREELPPIVKREYKSALKQLGTLGGGNHFIEIQRGNDGRIWIMIHSGSRNIGNKVAQHYNKLAKQLNERWHTEVPAKWDLAFLPIETHEAKLYLEEMQYCVEFAFANRNKMMESVKEAIFETLEASVEFGEMINIAHNHATWENHFGENVMVHRKGATRAYEGEIGIIPGSQGTQSYIVEGLGNPDSFKSCSHGAGRILGRKQAQRELNLENEIKRLDDKGIIHSIRGERDLDEAAGAYKDIHEVMQNQKDLVKIKVELEPLAVVKG